MLTVYGDIKSGNCYKVKLVLALLGIPHHWHDMDILQGDTQDDWYLQKHPFGKIPLIETSNGQINAGTTNIQNIYKPAKNIYIMYTIVPIYLI